MDSRVTREHHNLDHILTIRFDFSFGCQQAHHSCRPVLLKSGFQNHVGCWNTGAVDRRSLAVDMHASSVDSVDRRSLAVDRQASSVD
ncbi:hypothetical protein Taro_024885, partial [Colocasia esculenta]|nr:hypothetical protein [Colocasia esculenta]